QAPALLVVVLEPDLAAQVLGERRVIVLAEVDALERARRREDGLGVVRIGLDEPRVGALRLVDVADALVPELRELEEELAAQAGQPRAGLDRALEHPPPHPLAAPHPAR